MGKLLDSVYTNLKEYKEVVESGQINGIPFCFEPLRETIPIIRRGEYFLFTGRTKAAKSQITSEIMLFQIIFYAYHNQDKIHPHWLYFNWEESDEEVLERFMSYCLFKLSNKRIRISPIELESPDKNRILSDEVLELLQSDEYQSIFKYFEDCVEFCGDCKTTVAVDIKVKSYAREHGTCTYKEAYYKDELNQTHTTKSIDKYTPNDPLEYIFILIDHVSLVQTIQGQSLMQSIGTLSKQCVTYKNVYKYIPVIIQQQSKELGNLEANKQGRIRPDETFLSDCKSTVNECTYFFGICDPVEANVESYLGYDLTRLGHNFRILELIKSRRGAGNQLLPLYFDGAVNYFCPMPNSADSQSLNKIYNYLDSIKNKTKKKQSFVFLIIKKLTKNGK